MNWRHRIALIEQWNRVNLALTAKVLTFMYGPNFPELKIGDDDLIPQGMTNDCIAQSWYRFLNTIGNPVSLTKPEVNTNKTTNPITAMFFSGDKSNTKIPAIRHKH